MLLKSIPQSILASNAKIAALVIEVYKYKQVNSDPVDL